MINFHDTLNQVVTTRIYIILIILVNMWLAYGNIFLLTTFLESSFQPIKAYIKIFLPNQILSEIAFEPQWSP